MWGGGSVSSWELWQDEGGGTERFAASLCFDGDDAGKCGGRDSVGARKEGGRANCGDRGGGTGEGAFYEWNSGGLGGESGFAIAVFEGVSGVAGEVRASARDFDSAIRAE